MYVATYFKASAFKGAFVEQHYPVNERNTQPCTCITIILLPISWLLRGLSSMV